MCKKNCKCDPHEICEECPEWIFTLADLIMCMMGLFVILWVLKPDGKPNDLPTMDQADRETEVIAAIRDAFGYEPEPGSTDPIDVEVFRQRRMAAMDTGRARGPKDRGLASRSPDGATGTDPEVTTIRVGPVAAVGGRVVFDPGGQAISAESRRSLDQIAGKLRGHRNVVIVKGHAAADDLPDLPSGPSRDAALMSLSLDRARAAASALIDLGVDADTLRVQGAGPYEPVARRAYTPAAMATNRRVEVEATSTRAEELRAP